MPDFDHLDWTALDRLRAAFLSDASARATPYWQTHDTLAAYDATYAERIGWKWDALLRELAASGTALASAKVQPAALAELVNLVADGSLLQNVAKEVFADLVATGDTPSAIVARKGLAAAPTDTAELETWCRESIAANAKAVAEFKSGKESALNGLKGPVMKAAKGKANPKAVDETLRRLLAEP